MISQSITLDSLKSDLGGLILKFADFEAKHQQRVITTAVGEIKLNSGEEYVGLIVSADACKNHHIILLPGERNDINWKDANAWAESIGGELPDRCEGALLFATMKDRFQPEWYWTREQHASYSDYAWYQYFLDGHQYLSYESYQGRARAVRRVAI